MLSGPPVSAGIEGGWPVDIDAQASTWGPGTVASRMGPMRLWREATRHGCCEPPDGWGTGRLPHAMERVVRQWEEDRAQRAGREAGTMFGARRSAGSRADLWAGYRQAAWGHAGPGVPTGGSLVAAAGPGGAATGLTGAGAL